LRENCAVSAVCVVKALSCSLLFSYIPLFGLHTDDMWSMLPVKWLCTNRYTGSTRESLLAESS
jgi:hypothetical protein